MRFINLLILLIRLRRLRAIGCTTFYVLPPLIHTRLRSGRPWCRALCLMHLAPDHHWHGTCFIQVLMSYLIFNKSRVASFSSCERLSPASFHSLIYKMLAFIYFSSIRPTTSSRRASLLQVSLLLMQLMYISRIVIMLLAYNPKILRVCSTW